LHIFYSIFKNLEMEMEYSGAPNSLSFNLDIKLVKGIIIPVKIKLLKLNGTVIKY